MSSKKPKPKQPSATRNGGNHRTPVQLPAPTWQMTLPGKILTVCICFLPFFTRNFSVHGTQAMRDAYFLSDGAINDFEQLCRVFFLLGIAALALIYFFAERFLLRRPKREIPHDRLLFAVFLLFGVYLLLGLLSTVTSDYVRESLWGVYMNYEGYFTLVGYAVLFAAAWYWIDGEQLLSFTKTCLSVLSCVLGVLAIAEHFGYCYYNNTIVQKLGALNGYVSGGEDAVVMTFGNADYLGMYCALLLPVCISMLLRNKQKSQIVLQATAIVMLSAALILSEVMNAILIGFGLSVAFLLVWACHTQWKRTIKVTLCSVTLLAVALGGFGFLQTRDGKTLSEKLQHTLIGAQQEDTFGLLSIALDGNTISLKNADTTVQITAEETALSPETLTFVCNGTRVTPEIDAANGTCSFSQTGPEHFAATVREDRLVLSLGYATEPEFVRQSDGWTVVGIGGTTLTQVPQVSKSERLQQCYPYLNGRVFVWANTISVLDDCLILGHGPSTSIFYLEQNDLPALLNIFSTYVLYNKPHCWYLQIAQDTGILSLVAILGILGIFLVCGAKSCFGKNWNVFRAGLFFSILGYLLMACLNDSLIYQAPMFWFLLGIAFRQVSRVRMANAENASERKQAA